MKKGFNAISTLKRNRTKYQSSSLECGYSKECSHITHVLEVWHISYEGTGDNYHNSSMLRSSQVVRPILKFREFAAVPGN